MTYEYLETLTKHVNSYVEWTSFQGPNSVTANNDYIRLVKPSEQARSLRISNSDGSKNWWLNFSEREEVGLGAGIWSVFNNPTTCNKITEFTFVLSEYDENFEHAEESNKIRHGTFTVKVTQEGLKLVPDKNASLEVKLYSGAKQTP